MWLKSDTIICHGDNINAEAHILQTLESIPTCIQYRNESDTSRYMPRKYPITGLFYIFLSQYLSDTSSNKGKALKRNRDFRGRTVTTSMIHAPEVDLETVANYK